MVIFKAFIEHIICDEVNGCGFTLASFANENQTKFFLRRLQLNFRIFHNLFMGDIFIEDAFGSKSQSDLSNKVPFLLLES